MREADERQEGWRGCRGRAARHQHCAPAPSCLARGAGAGWADAAGPVGFRVELPNATAAAAAPALLTAAAAAAAAVAGFDRAAWSRPRGRACPTQVRGRRNYCRRGGGGAKTSPAPFARSPPPSRPARARRRAPAAVNCRPRDERTKRVDFRLASSL